MIYYIHWQCKSYHLCNEKLTNIRVDVYVMFSLLKKHKNIISAILLCMAIIDVYVLTIDILLSTIYKMLFLRI